MVTTRVLIALLSLLAFAASARAECARVLWQELMAISEARLDKEWGISVATPSEAECNNQLRQAVQGRAKQLRTPGPSGVEPSVRLEGNSVTHVFKGGLLWYRYLCLSDTVDPRGPKGK